MLSSSKRTDRSQGRPGGYPQFARPRDDRPPTDERQKRIDDRKEKFEALNIFVTRHGGWVTSVPGAMDVTIEVPETSELPGKLRDLGYLPVEIGRRERMVPNATTEEFYSSAIIDGERVNVKSRTVAHAGFVPVVMYAFEL
jgi:hypothetical protein